MPHSFVKISITAQLQAGFLPGIVQPLAGLFFIGMFVEVFVAAQVITVAGQGFKLPLPRFLLPVIIVLYKELFLNCCCFAYMGRTSFPADTCRRPV